MKKYVFWGGGVDQEFHRHFLFARFFAFFHDLFILGVSKASAFKSLAKNVMLFYNNKSMVKVKLVFKNSKGKSRKVVLCYQVVYGRKNYLIDSGYHIDISEFDAETGISLHISREQNTYMKLLEAETRRIEKRIAQSLEPLTTLETELMLNRYVRFSQKGGKPGNSVFGFLERQRVYLQSLGRTRSSEIVKTTLRSFQRFRQGLDLSFPFWDRELMEQYEAYLKGLGLLRNTTSFYMRVLRMVYHKACEEGLTWDNRPFSKVYTGIDKTTKRAVGVDELRRILDLKLPWCSSLDFSRDMFLFSFFMRGMSFVDMAFLKKQDLQCGYLSYRRKKTGQLLTIKWTAQMQQIVNKYHSETVYLLPIIKSADGRTERRQYQNQLVRVNRQLKKVGSMAGLGIPLSTYVSRHSWASIARDKHIPLSIISEGLGHNNEVTTQIYLDSIRNVEIDRANQVIMGELF